MEQKRIAAHRIGMDDLGNGSLPASGSGRRAALSGRSGVSRHFVWTNGRLKSSLHREGVSIVGKKELHFIGQRGLPVTLFLSSGASVTFWDKNSSLSRDFGRRILDKALPAVYC